MKERSDAQACMIHMTSSRPGCPATAFEGAKRRTSMCQAYYCTFHIRERYIVPVSSNFLTQISCGIKTKCRKTRAMQRDFTIVDSLALRQCNTSMIPDTHSLKLLFPTRYYLSLNLLLKKLHPNLKALNSYFYESGRFIIF